MKKININFTKLTWIVIIVSVFYIYLFIPNLKCFQKLILFGIPLLGISFYVFYWEIIYSYGYKTILPKKSTEAEFKFQKTHMIYNFKNNILSEIEIIKIFKKNICFLDVEYNQENFYRDYLHDEINDFFSRYKKAIFHISEKLQILVNKNIIKEYENNNEYYIIGNYCQLKLLVKKNDNIIYFDDDLNKNIEKQPLSIYKMFLGHMLIKKYENITDLNELEALLMKELEQ